VGNNSCGTIPYDGKENECSVDSQCTVNANPINTPTVDIYVNGSNAPTAIPANTAATVGWISTNVTSCTASGSWSGAKGVSGSESTGNLISGTYTYELSCTGAGGSSSDSVTLNVQPANASPAPTVDIYINGSNVPGAIPENAEALIGWNATNATTCTASGNWLGTKAISGSESTGPLTSGSHTYTLECSGPGGSGKDSVAISVQKTETPATGNNAACENIDAPDEAIPGKRFTAVVTMRNTGSVVWDTSSSRYTIKATTNDWGSSGFRLPADTIIRPQEVVAIPVHGDAPENEGIFQFGWRMVDQYNLDDNDQPTPFGTLCLKTIIVKRQGSVMPNTHLECRDDSCIVVSGIGENQCSEESSQSSTCSNIRSSQNDKKKLEIREEIRLRYGISTDSGYELWQSEEILRILNMIGKGNVSVITGDCPDCNPPFGGYGGNTMYVSRTGWERNRFPRVILHELYHSHQSANPGWFNDGLSLAGAIGNDPMNYLGSYPAGVLDASSFNSVRTPHNGQSGLGSAEFSPSVGEYIYLLGYSQAATNAQHLKSLGFSGPVAQYNHIASFHGAQTVSYGQNQNNFFAALYTAFKSIAQTPNSDQVVSNTNREDMGTKLLTSEKAIQEKTAVLANAPSVVIISPGDGAILTEPVLTIAGTAFASNSSQSRVVRVQITLNNQALPAITPAIAECGSNVSCFSFNANLTLLPGANEIKAVAIDANGKESEPNRIIVTYITADAKARELPPSVDVRCSSDDGESYNDDQCTGEESNLKWEVLNATQCTPTDTAPDASWESTKDIATTNGSGVLRKNLPRGTYRYSLRCSGPGGTTSDLVTVKISKSNATAPSVSALTSRLTIRSFTAQKPTLVLGQSAKLSWRVTDATSIAIDNGIGNVGASGNLTVTPQETTTYILTATDVNGVQKTAKATVRVVSARAPAITIFRANKTKIEEGNKAVLSWSTQGLTNLTVGGISGTKPVKGTLTVQPMITTSYTLTGTSPEGEVSKTVTIIVVPKSVTIRSFTAQKASIIIGQSAKLAWRVTEAEIVSIDNGIGEVAPSGNLTVTPQETTTYILTATDVNGVQKIAKATVRVSPPPPFACAPLREKTKVKRGVQFRVSGAEPKVPYTWSAPEGTPSQGTNKSPGFTVTYGTVGTKTVTVSQNEKQVTCAVEVTE
jgi:hypothetical protein